MSAMRAAAVFIAAAALVGCGGEADQADEADGMRGDPEAGRVIFTERADPTCGSCHTLEAAGATGTTAPNLDELQPSFDQVVNAVRTGPGIMPSFSDQLSDEEIDDVATYVAEAAG